MEKETSHMAETKEQEEERKSFITLGGFSKVTVRLIHQFFRW